jgi:hypothetical protein
MRTLEGRMLHRNRQPCNLRDSRKRLDVAIAAILDIASRLQGSPLDTGCPGEGQSVHRATIVEYMANNPLPEWIAPTPSARTGHQGCENNPLALRVARWSHLVSLAIAACLCSGFSLSAQTSDSQPSDANKTWTAATESHSDNLNPTRTIESHTQSGNRTLDNQSLQRRGSDGQFEPYQDIEKTTVQVNATTLRTTTRTFGRDADGAKTLIQVTEEEKRTLPGGNSNLVRSTSNPDADGNLQVVQREIGETKKISKGLEETNTTVLLPGISGDLAPTVKVQERREQDANDTVVFQKTTLLPDGAGNWQVSETRQATTRQEGKNSSVEEHVSRPDAEGKLSEISRTVSKESENASGEKRSTVDTYSVDLPGAAQDGSLHLVERTSSTQGTGSAGQQTTVRGIDKPNPADPGAGLQVTILSTDTVQPGPSGAGATQTIQMRDANGSFGVVSVDTAKSDNIHAIQVQIAPSEKPK